MTNGVVKMAETVWKRKVFEFGAEHYVRVSGTAIRTKMAPSYANIFMSQLEGKILEEVVLKPMEFCRFHRWLSSYANIERWNSCVYLRRWTRSIRASNSHTITGRQISTSWTPLCISSKTVVSGQIFSPSRRTLINTYSHLVVILTMLRRSIGYSQTIRNRNICNDDVTARKRAAELTENLVERGHSRRKVRRGLKRAFNIPLQEIVVGEKKARITTRIPLVTTYHQKLPDISSIFTSIPTYCSTIWETEASRHEPNTTRIQTST